MGAIIGIIIIVAIFYLAIRFLRGFDKIAGRGPKQIKDGIQQSGVIDSPKPEPSYSSELEKLVRLRDRGDLTPTEFEILKTKLLG
jgi:hypothetical protein